MSLSRETNLVQNEALGATLVWKFSASYYENHPKKKLQPLLLSFIVLPILLHKDLLTIVSSTQTRSGLRKFVEKLSDTSEARQDLLYAIHPRAEKWRDLTISSLRMGMATRLIRLENSAELLPLTNTTPFGIPPSIRPLVSSSAKLGEWCAVLSLHEISTLLHLRF